MEHPPIPSKLTASAAPAVIGRAKAVLRGTCAKAWASVAPSIALRCTLISTMRAGKLFGGGSGRSTRMAVKGVRVPGVKLRSLDNRPSGAEPRCEEPPSKRMQLMKPAQAMELRSLSLVLDGRRTTEHADGCPTRMGSHHETGYRPRSRTSAIAGVILSQRAGRS